MIWSPNTAYRDGYRRLFRKRGIAALILMIKSLFIKPEPNRGKWYYNGKDKNEKIALGHRAFLIGIRLPEASTFRTLRKDMTYSETKLTNTVYLGSAH